MRPASALTCLLLALAVASATARKPFRPARSLLSPRFTTADICSKPQETSKTIAATLVSGSGLAAAESQAIADAGSQCCSQLTTALIAAQAQAQASGTGDAFSTAAARAAASASLTGCARDAFAAVTATATTGPGGAHAGASAGASGSGNAAAGSTSTRAVLRLGPDGRWVAESSGAVNP